MAQASIWVVAAAGAATAGLSAWAEQRRTKRRKLDAVGFMPWTLLTIVGVIVALFGAALAISGKLP